MTGEAKSCFDLHATHAMRMGMESIGEYHRFLIDRAFTYGEQEVRSLRSSINYIFFIISNLETIITKCACSYSSGHSV